MKTVDEGLTMNQLAERNAEHVGTIAALEAKCAALMAGIDYLRGEIKQHSKSTHFCSRCGEADPSSTDDVCRALKQPMPAADAWRNQVRAEGAHFVANDVYWLSDLLPTDDFSKARVFSAPAGTETNLVWLPFALVDAKKRLTFSTQQINRHTMIQGAGLRVPDWLKKMRRRQKTRSGKTRWNCPCCGKISWQFNPYDFEGCRNFSCEGWRP